MIVIYCDNLKVVQRCNNEINKSSLRANESMSSVKEIKRLINELAINVSIEYASSKRKVPVTFESNPGLFLIKQCNARAKRIRLLVEQGK